MLEQEWKERFGRFAAQHDKDASIAGWSEHGLQRRLEIFSRSLEGASIPREGLVLDLGCGPGTYSRLLSNRGFRVVGVDYSLPILKKAKGSDPAFSCLTGDCYDLPFRSETFNAVVCIGVFQCLSRERAALHEIWRVLKPGGTLFLMTLNALSLRAALRGAVKRVKKRFGLKLNGVERQSFHLYHPYRFQKELRRHQFGTVGMSRLYLFPASLSGVERELERRGILRWLDKLPLISDLLGQDFLIQAYKRAGNGCQ